jgi:NTE family protein
MAMDLQSTFEADAAIGDFLNARKVEDRIGLCLSGGGYRAAIYHLGSLVRLNELGLMSRLDEIASVSGGSITAGALAYAWPRLTFGADGSASNFAELVCAPLIRFSGISIDIAAIVVGLLPGRTAAGEVARAYDRHLFHGATLQDLPDRPRFTFMTTNLQSGTAWRFAKDYAADSRVGRIEKPDLSLSRVVSASSAFPPWLSPARISFAAGQVKDMEWTDLHRSPFIDEAILTDGGVYDNLGLERVWRRCRTILVSNACLTIPAIGTSTGRLVGQTFRAITLIQQQADNARRRILMGMNNLGQRQVSYWSVDQPIDSYGLADSLQLSPEEVAQAASMRVRLNRLTRDEIRLLLRAGYAGTDASLRARKLAKNVPPARFENLPDSW